MSFNDQFLKEQADPLGLTALVKSQYAQLQQMSLGTVRVQALDEIAQEIGQLDFRAIDADGKLRMIMSAVNLVNQLGVNGHFAGVDPNGVVQFWVNADDGKFNIKAEAYPSITPVEWVADNDGEVVARMLGWYVINTASGAYIIGRGKDASHKGVAGLMAIKYNDSTYNTAVIFDVDETGESVLNLTQGSNDAKGTQALVISTNIRGADNAALNTLLYLDSSNKSTPADGFGSAIAFRAEDTNGDLESLGYLGIRFEDSAHGSERSNLVGAQISGSGSFREFVLPGAGFQPYAMMDGASNVLNFSADSAVLAANGEARAIPITLYTPMLLQSVSVWNNDTATQRTWSWGLYVQKTQTANSDENTLTRVATASAAETFTPTVASLRTIAASSAPVFLGPGVYWLVIQNQHASNTFSLGRVSAATNMGNTLQAKIITNPMGSTLDFVAATWTRGTGVMGVRLNGNVFGQASAF